MWAVGRLRVLGGGTGGKHRVRCCVGTGGGGGAKWGRFVIFPVPCLPAYGDTALKFLQACGAHEKGCDQYTSRAVFPASGYLGTPKHCKTRENTK